MRLQKIRDTREMSRVDSSLKILEEQARSGEGNLLETSIEAVRARASVGEISMALEKQWGRYSAPIQTVSGVYAHTYSGQDEIEAVRQKVSLFAEKEGRRPRILVAKMGQDGHDRGAKLIATAFSDLGFDVDFGPLFQTPEEVAKQALENDVHVIGISTQAAGHKPLISELMTCLRKIKAEGIRVVAGGVIPPADHEFLKELGVASVFGPGTRIPEAAIKVLESIQNRSD